MERSLKSLGSGTQLNKQMLDGSVFYTTGRLNDRPPLW